MDKTINEIVKTIKEFPQGKRFTVAELLAQHGVDTKNTKNMFEYYKQIYSQISDIVKTPNAHATVGLPFNIPLEKCK